MSQQNLITFFLTSFRGGGAERVIIELANSFHARGHAVELVVGNAVGPYKEEINPEINVTDFKKKRVIACLIPLSLYLFRKSPAVIYATMMHANVMVLIAKILSFSTAKVVIREAVTTEKTNEKPVEAGKTILLRLAALLYPKAHAVIAVSNGVAASLERDLNLTGKLNLSVIYNPVISSRFFAKSEENDIQLEFKRPESLLLIAVARLAKSKDYPTMLKAIALVKQHRDVQLLILGEGVERDALEQLVSDLHLQDDVHMPGFVNNPFKYLRKADLFVHSSLYEGMPNSVIQALALNKRAVVTRTKDGPEELFSGVHGVSLVESGDPAVFANAILALLSQDSDVARDDVWFEKFDSDTIVSQYEEFLS